MLHCAVKFCGGCNPRFDRGAVYRQIRQALECIAVFETAQEGAAYDVLLIIRGCTGCPYLYEEITAAHRVLLVSLDDMDAVISQIEHIHNRGA